MGIGSLIGGIGSSIFGGAMSSSAAKEAAQTQADAAKYAADLQSKASQNALDFQKQQYETAQQQQASWLQAGQGGLSALQYGLGLGGNGANTGVGESSLLRPYGQQFQAPTGLTESNDPGYQARLKLGTDALQRSAAARGNVLTGGTAKALNQYAQDYASNEFGNVYNRALSDYTTKYNAYNQDQANQYNRLAALSGIGQTSANQLASQGQAASNNVSNNLLQTAQNMGQQANNAGAATASGYAGAANAWNNAAGGIANTLGQYGMIRSLGSGGYGGGYQGGYGSGGGLTQNEYGMFG